MYGIIVGFPKIEDANYIKNLIARSGYQVSEACTLGSQIISRSHDFEEGIVICGFRFADMHYTDVSSSLPTGFKMLLLASPEKLEYCRDNNIICLPLPIKGNDLFNTLQMMTDQRSLRKRKDRDKPKVRSDEGTERIKKAKEILMDRNNMTEAEAYRYLQKNSMDSGTSMVEMADMVLKVFTVD